MANNTLPFGDRPEIIPGQNTDWWRASAKNRRQFKLMQKLERDKLESDTETFSGVAATSNDVLVYNGFTWVPTDLSALVSLDDLTDVNLTAPSANEFLRHNGSEWTNQAVTIVSTLDDLSDVTITTPTSGDALIYNGSIWVNQATSTTLDGLSDVNVPLPTDGDFLTWNDSMSEWEARNWTPSAFGVGEIAIVAKLEVNTNDATTRGIVVRGFTAQTADLFQARDISDNLIFTIGPTGPVTLLDAVDVVLGTATGTKIGTSTSAKIGFWNKTPVVQPAAYSVANPTTDRALDVTGDTLAQGLAVLGTLIADLKLMGLIG